MVWLFLGLKYITTTTFIPLADKPVDSGVQQHNSCNIKSVYFFPNIEKIVTNVQKLTYRNKISRSRELQKPIVTSPHYLEGCKYLLQSTTWRALKLDETSCVTTFFAISTSWEDWPYDGNRFMWVWTCPVTIWTKWQHEGTTSTYIAVWFLVIRRPNPNLISIWYCMWRSTKYAQQPLK